MADARLEELRSALQQLDTALEAAEAMMRALRLGVDAELELSDGSTLRWGQHLTVEDTRKQPARSLHVVDPARGTVDHVLKTAPATRVLAAQAVPLLIRRMHEARAAVTTDVREAASQLESYLDTLEG